MKKWLKENKFYLITILIVVALFNIKLPYYIDTPGGTININDRIEYKEQIEYDGSLNMLYVTEYIATIPTYLLSFIIKDWDLQDLSANQISNESPEEINIRNKIMLTNSINTAKYVAYKEVGEEISIKDSHNIIIATTKENSLKIGDEILEINNVPINDINNIKEIIDSYNIGDYLEIKLKRNEQTITKKVPITGEGDKKEIGIVVITNYEYNTKKEIGINFKPSESGSSGGLMMTLSIYNALSSEDILKGRHIAGTGTIDVDGNVGEIAGIKYKIIGAHNNDMDIVLVPEGNYEEAKQVVEEKNYDIKIVKIKTFKEAVTYLKTTN